MRIEPSSLGGFEIMKEYLFLNWILVMGLALQVCQAATEVTTNNSTIQTGAAIAAENCCDLPGDANSDELMSIGDVTFLINYIFHSGPPPECCAKGDTDNNGKINIGDVSRITAALFTQGPLPVCGAVEMTCSADD